jgi:uncharacterized protein YbaR (Trm112 family)
MTCPVCNRKLWHEANHKTGEVKLWCECGYEKKAKEE